MVFAFEPGDLISETMSLGAPAPIEVVVSGRNLAEASTYMDKLRDHSSTGSSRCATSRSSSRSTTRSVQVTLDRERAGLSGVTARDIGESLIAATYSSRYTTRIFWRDDVSGNSYQVQVQVPPPRMTEATDVELVPLLAASPAAIAPRRLQGTPSTPKPPLLIRDVARVMRSEMIGEVDRYNMRRYLSLTANIEGEDLGRVIDRLDAAIVRAGQPPRGTEVELRGQVGPMREMFLSLEIGLGVAVVVILIMLTAYFQEARLAVTAVASVPAVLCGVVLALARHAIHPEHRVVHGGDHGRRRGGLERDHAGELRRPPPPRGRHAGRPRGHHRGQGKASPDHHDRLRHDRGHDPDVTRH